ncbi:hypothetical protein ACQP2F_08760 [Actinoplanes sp. CA-030573]|uniref:hypothetical protein n=1 Tax=Actinoplanes sp. CA-030573 TaxID=3239898 RepID=UPI003D9283A5
MSGYVPCPSKWTTWYGRSAPAAARSTSPSRANVAGRTDPAVSRWVRTNCRAASIRARPLPGSRSSSHGRPGASAGSDRNSA